VIDLALGQYASGIDAYDAFGPQRMMWGSDLSRLRGTCCESVTMFTERINRREYIG